MIRIGVDFGGTKIEAAALDAQGRFVARVRGPSPRQYDAGLEAVRDLVAEAERRAGAKAARIGVGGPGSVSPAGNLMRGANSTELNGHPFPQDLERVLGRPVRYENDANCLALSEATDGAGQGHRVVFAAILGTGCGAGITVDGRILTGRNAFAGEWGHAPLPWPTEAEHPGPACWCGRRGCLETWISGTAFAVDYARATGRRRPGPEIVAAAAAGEPEARAALDRYVDRLARSLAVIVDVIDPDLVVLGGGMSNVAALYAETGAMLAGYVFSDVCVTRIVQARHGDSSGVRGAAWLWPSAEGPEGDFGT
jgi:fructokinase